MIGIELPEAKKLIQNSRVADEIRVISSLRV